MRPRSSGGPSRFHTQHSDQSYLRRQISVNRLLSNIGASSSRFTSSTTSIPAPQFQQRQQHTPSRPLSSVSSTGDIHVSRMANPMLSHRSVSTPPADTASISSSSTTNPLKAPRRLTTDPNPANNPPVMSMSSNYIGPRASTHTAAQSVKSTQSSRFVSPVPASLTRRILPLKSQMAPPTKKTNVNSTDSSQSEQQEGQTSRAIRGRRTGVHNSKLMRPIHNRQHRHRDQLQESVNPTPRLPLQVTKQDFQQKSVVRFAESPIDVNQKSELIPREDILQPPIYQLPSLDQLSPSSRERFDPLLRSSKKKYMMQAQPRIALGKMRRATSDTCLYARVNTKDIRQRLPSAHPYISMMQLPFQSTFKNVTYDVSAALDFAQRTIDIVNDGAICVLVSLGHKLGIFQAMAQQSGQYYTAKAISVTAKLYVRPVEEFLCAMACAGIVEMRTEDDPSSAIMRVTFALPAEHAVWLTWGGGRHGTFASGTNLALLCQTIPALGRVEHAVAVGYRDGTGISPTAYFDYEQIQAHDILQTVGVRMLSVIKLVPSLIEELTNGACVLCLGGPADEVYVRLAKYFPRSWFTCYSTDELRVEGMRKSTESLGVTNVHFKAVPHLEHVFERASYDVALVLDGAPVRQCINPVGCIQAIRRALRPSSPLIYIEMMAAGDVVSDQSHTVAMFLYSVAAMYSLPRAIQHGSDGTAAGGIWGHVNVRNAMYDASFAEVQAFPLEDDSLNCVLVATAPGPNGTANIQF